MITYLGFTDQNYIASTQNWQDGPIRIQKTDAEPVPCFPGTGIDATDGAIDQMNSDMFTPTFRQIHLGR